MYIYRRYEALPGLRKRADSTSIEEGKESREGRAVTCHWLGHMDAGRRCNQTGITGVMEETTANSARTR